MSIRHSRVGTKFRLKMTLEVLDQINTKRVFQTKKMNITVKKKVKTKKYTFPKKGYFRLKTQKSINITTEFFIFELV